LTERVDDQVHSEPAKGNVSEGGVDERTGMTTGAIAGALVGASLGPIGLMGGAIAGGILGREAAAGPEHPHYPEPWPTRRDQLHAHEQKPERRDEGTPIL